MIITIINTNHDFGYHCVALAVQELNSMNGHQVLMLKKASTFKNNGHTPKRLNQNLTTTPSVVICKEDAGK